MVNLNKFKIKITATIPRKFRKVVEDAISDSFLLSLDYATDFFDGISSSKLWKLEYEPWNGFVIYAEDNKNKEYASIVKWLNYGTTKHLISSMGKFKTKSDFTAFMSTNKKSLRFLVFPDRGTTKKGEHIEGNIVFKKDGNIYALIVEHPGIMAKRFVEDSILENDYVENRFYEQVKNSKIFSDSDYYDQSDLLPRINTGRRDVLGITS
jgi:hypothetical protein